MQGPVVAMPNNQKEDEDHDLVGHVLVRQPGPDSTHETSLALFIEPCSFDLSGA